MKTRLLAFLIFLILLLPLRTEASTWSTECATTLAGYTKALEELAQMRAELDERQAQLVPQSFSAKLTELLRKLGPEAPMDEILRRIRERAEEIRGLRQTEVTEAAEQRTKVKGSEVDVLPWYISQVLSPATPSLLNAVNKIMFSPTSSQVIVGRGNQLAAWDYVTGAPSWSHDLPFELSSFALHPDGIHATLGTDEGVKVYRLDRLEESASPFVGPKQPTDPMYRYFSADGQLLAEWEPRAKEFSVWDATTRALRSRFASPRPTGVRFSPNHRYVALHYDGEAHLYDLHTKQEVAIPQAALIEKVLRSRSLIFSPDGETVAITGQERQFGPQRVKFWNIRTGQISPISAGSFFTGPVFSPRGDFLVSLPMPDPSRDAPELLDIANNHSLRGLLTPNPGFKASALAFSPQGDELAVGGNEGTILVVHLRNHSVSTYIDPEGDQIFRLAFSPDGKSLVAGDDRGRTVVWRRGTN